MSYLITKKNGELKHYIYKTDVRKFLQCDDETADEIFLRVKDYELETRVYEMFENRVPQDLFHEWRNKRRKRGN